MLKKIDYHQHLYKDHIYHIYNRGNGTEKIFFNNDNYRYFLSQFRKYTLNLLDVFAYCLLPNHFHLLIRIVHEDPLKVSAGLRRFLVSYSMSVNKQQKRKGNLFQRSIKRKEIADEKYFFTAVYYIHANPIHHKIIKDLTCYEYSSYKSIISDKETSLLRNEVLEWFGGKNNFINFHINSKDCYDESLLIEC